MSALPTRTIMSDPFPAPTDAQARAWHLANYDFCNNLLGADGTPETARATLGIRYMRRRNMWINGNVAIDTRNKGVAKTLTAGAAPIYTIDRIYASCTGANATIQQTTNGYENRLLLAGSSGCTGIKFGTRIIAENTGGIGRAGNLTQSLLISSSAITVVNWAAYQPTSTKNGFGALASPTRTLVASGSFSVSTINAEEKRYSAQFSLGFLATTGIGIEPTRLRNGINIEFSIGAQASGASISFGEFQLEPDYVSPNYINFEDAPFENSVRDCAFYCREVTTQGRNYVSTGGLGIDSPVMFETMYKAPSRTYVTGTGLLSNASSPDLYDLTVNSARFSFTSAAAGDAYALGRRYLLDAELS